MKTLGFIFMIVAATSVAHGASTFPTADAVFPDLEMESVQLGQLLFYDPILSGNKNIACATCHHPSLGTSDGVSLGIGEGGIGLGMKRQHDPNNPPEARIPRNAPALWNLGATEFTVMFHDGRIEANPDKPNAMRTPLGEEMAVGFKSPLAAQAMFPVLSADEMAGQFSENDVSKAVRMGQNSQVGGAWDIIAARIESIPAYRALFDVQIGHETPITFPHIANVIADFIAFEWRADDSLFDRHLRGEAELDGPALLGMELFYGDAKCGSCHSGQFQTDHAFHAIAMPQLGPGKALAFESHARDTGRMAVTGKTQDAYAFRTPSLRNLSVTGPYGHAGAYSDLRDVVEHHLSPVASLENYDPARSTLPAFTEVGDWRIQTNPGEISDIASASELVPNHSLSESDVDALMAFLATLEDTKMGQGRLGIPKRLPSGLPLD